MSDASKDITSLLDGEATAPDSRMTAIVAGWEQRAVLWLQLLPSAAFTASMKEDFVGNFVLQQGIKPEDF